MNPESEHTAQPRAETTLDLSCILVPLLRAIEQLDTKIEHILEQLEGLKKGEAVFGQMHNRLQELTEQCHEREVLGPVFLTLIGIADRCRETATRAQVKLERLHGSNPNCLASALRELHRARVADLTEVENLLSIFGVEWFRSPRTEFDPAKQKCVAQVECASGEQNGHVAERLRPGYRRNGTLIRPEYVKVYALARKKGTTS